MTAIIDYGMGNIHSVQKALESLGEATLIVTQPEEIKKCQKLVLPGVGAFDDAVIELKKQGLFEGLLEHIKNKKIFLGICLGMQLLFKKSQEAKTTSGLGILQGAVDKFKEGQNLKVPHMGWNQLKIKNNCPLLKGISNGAYVYFCHSYYAQPDDTKVNVASCDYGLDFAAVIWKDNIYGVQFHPEKSQQTGLKILENFIQL